MINRILEYVQDNSMITNKDTVIVGLSGGADSVCLLLVLKEISNRIDFNIQCVHVNHNIRGEEALRDQQFCVDLCREMNIPLKIYSVKIMDIAKTEHLSVEEAGRKYRYECFRKEAEEYGECGKIAVAHHMDDQCETVLHNIFRGSKIQGASGMWPQRDGIIRPLLCVRRKDIEEYLAQKNRTYVTDSTNLQDEYTRNRLRNIIIPEIAKTINPSVVENVCSMADMMRESQDFIQSCVETAIKECVIINADGKTGDMVHSVCIDAKAFSRMHKVVRTTLIRQMLVLLAGHQKDIYSVHINLVDRLFEMQVGKQVNVAYRISAKRGYDSVILSKQDPAMLNAEREAGEKALENRTSHELDDFTMEIIVDGSINIKNIKNVSNDYTKYFDYDKMKAKPVFRGRKPGDYIVINSDGNRKKLKDYLIDVKVPKDERDSIKLFAVDSEIIWIPGLRAGCSYMVDESTKRVVKIQLEKI